MRMRTKMLIGALVAMAGILIPAIEAGAKMNGI